MARKKKRRKSQKRREAKRARNRSQTPSRQASHRVARAEPVPNRPKPPSAAGPESVTGDPGVSQLAATPPSHPESAATKERPPILRVWRNPNFVLFEMGWTPQSITSWIQRVGVAWLALELSNSNAWVGAVAAADLAPMIVLAPIAGALTDRAANPMRQLILNQVLLLVQALILAGLAYAGIMNIQILFGLSLVTGVINPFTSAARQTVLVSSIQREDFAPAIALDSALFQASRFVGPAIAAVMISVWGVPSALLVHVAGSLIAVVCLGMMRLPERSSKGRLNRGLLIDIVDSVTYVRAHGAIWPLFLLLTMSSLLLRPVQDLLPGFASKVFGAGPEGLGWLASAMGVGAMISAVSIAVRGKVHGLGDWAIIGGILLVAATLGFTSSDRLELGLVFAALTAYSLNTMSTSIQTITQSTVADDMRARVMSLYTLIFRGLPAIGAVVLGALADRIGLQRAFAVSAVLSLVVWLLVALQRRSIAEALAPAAHKA